VPTVGEQAQRQVEPAGAAIAGLDTDAAVAQLSAAVRGFMHGSSFSGDGQRALGDLATRYDELIANRLRLSSVGG
jgi:hypothetical protein